jgi:predicted secreted protein
MSWTTIAAIYFIVWWIVLFAVLPWGVRSQDEAGDVVPGSDPGAPAIPRLGLKIIWTTIVSAVLMAAVYAVFAAKLLSIDDLARFIGMPIR